jgi:hypothetical protein
MVGRSWVESLRGEVGEWFADVPPLKFREPHGWIGRVAGMTQIVKPLPILTLPAWEPGDSVK